MLYFGCLFFIFYKCYCMYMKISVFMWIVLIYNKYVILLVDLEYWIFMKMRKVLLVCLWLILVCEY